MARQQSLPNRVPTAQGKQGKCLKKISVKENTGNLEILPKHREFSLNTGKTQGILLAQVVNVLILKVKDNVIVAPKKSYFPEAGYVCQVSSVDVLNTHKLCKLAQGKFAVRQGKLTCVT